jgi:hypothetical protein
MRRLLARFLGGAALVVPLVAMLIMAMPGVASAQPQAPYQGHVTSNTYSAAAGSSPAPPNSGSPYDPLKYDCTTPSGHSTPTEAQQEPCQHVGLTHAYWDDHQVNLLYSANFYCDRSVPSHATTGCEGGKTYNHLPPDATSQDTLYIPTPLGFTPSQGLQCPMPGNCIDHPSTIDVSALYPVLKPLLHLTSPSQLYNAPLSPHSHLIFNRNNNLPEWWNVEVVPVTNQAGFNRVISATSKSQLMADLGTDGVYKAVVPTNVFLYFQVLAGTSSEAAPAATSQNVYNGADGPAVAGDPLVNDCSTQAACSRLGVGLTQGYLGTATGDVLYTQNYFCDKSVSARSSTGCEAGASYNKLPPGTTSSSETEPLYIVTPLFKPEPTGLQCPVTGYCIDHPGTVDLSRLASVLDPILGTTPSQLDNAPLSPHSHIVLTANNSQPEWWNVKVVGVTNQAAFNQIMAAPNKYAEVQALQANSSSGVTAAIPTNIFLWFQVLPAVVPSQAPSTGGGGTAGLQHSGLIAGGGTAMALGLGLGTVMITRRRRANAA